MSGFIKFNRESKSPEWIMSKRVSAWALLCIIAKRAKRTNDHPDKTLQAGEAEIGDYKIYGVTEQIYRSDKRFLETNGLITTRTTNRGTIAKLISSDIFDINCEELTNSLPENQQAANGQPTTNKNDKNVKNKKIKIKKKKVLDQNILFAEMQEIVDKYNSEVNGNYKLTDGIKVDLAYWLKQYTKEEIITAISRINQHDFWKQPRYQTITFFLKQKKKDGNQDAIGDLLAFQPERAGVDLQYFNPFTKIKN